MKNFKIAALSLAVGSVLTAGQAFAGTEACFESYRVTNDVDGVSLVDGLVTNHDVLYTPASCEARTGATDTSLEALDNANIAWELTGDYDVNFESFAAITRQHIVYIPTTDIPSASRIQMKLTGADFGENNSNQMYLVVDDGTDLTTIASSDGSFDNTDTVEFLTKAGVTIGAGSRLLLSALNPELSGNVDDNLIAGISIHLANEESCDPDPEVTIEAISAKTDGGSSITGAVSQDPVAILNVAEQFVLLDDAEDTTVVEVNAEDPSFRTQFVVESGVIAIEESAFWEAKFINNFADFDNAIIIDSDDDFTLDIKASSATGDGVVFTIETDQDDAADSSILDDGQANYRIASGTDVVEIFDEDGDQLDDDEIVLTTSTTSYRFEADELFDVANVSTVANIAAILTNLDDEIMEFNYEVDTTYGLDFDDSAYLDKVACESDTPFEVGVNGAVLKVPYVFDITSNWVRITSEHDSQATIFLDVFDESSNTIKNVEIGTIEPKSSVVHTVKSMLDMAETAGYSSSDTRHTMTFTVTAPKNSVHGVSVQAIPGGVDRVMPVLDQNDWTQ